MGFLMFSYLKNAAIWAGLINSDERNQEIRDWYNEKVSEAYVNHYRAQARSFN